MNVEPFILLHHIGSVQGQRISARIEWDGVGLEFAGLVGDHVALPGIEDRLVDASATIQYVEPWTTDALLDLVMLWKRWTGSALRPGTPAQMEALRMNPMADRWSPAERASWLSSVELNPDPSTGERYGSAWWTETVPPSVIVSLLRLAPVG